MSGEDDYTEEREKLLLRRERRFAVEGDYLEKLPLTKEWMRERLVDWMTDLGLDRKVHWQTLFHAVQLTDRFLARRRDVPHTRLQLLGAAALYVACKFEEDFELVPRVFVEAADKAFTQKELLCMEISLLECLEHELSVPTPLVFFERLLPTHPSGSNSKAAWLGGLLLLLSLRTSETLRWLPSVQARAALGAAHRLLPVDRSTETVQDSEEEECIQHLRRLYDAETTKSEPVKVLRHFRKKHGVGAPSVP